MKAKMSKKSTLTITIMACLLAVAVATTIVLAAFTANKQASTVITFSNGVQIRIDGAYRTANDAGDDDVISKSPIDKNGDAVTLLWGCTEGSTTHNDSATVSNVSQNITFDPISFVNGTSSESTTAWLVAKATIECTTAASGAPVNAISITRDSGWVAVGSNGWYAYAATAASNPDITLGGTGLDMTDLTTTGATNTADFVTAASIAADGTTIKIDDLAAASYTATVKVWAVNAQAADAESVLAGIIAAA